MAQRHPDSPPLPAAPVGLTAGDVLAGHLAEHAAEFLRALRLRGEPQRGEPQRGELRRGEPRREEAEAAANRLLRASARRISAALLTYEPLVDAAWAENLRGELGWLCSILAREQRYGTQLARLRAALVRLASDGGPEAEEPAARGPVSVGAARAGALLERQLTLARTRAHSTTLQTFGSARFHAVADAVALLASELPLSQAAAAPARQALPPLAERAQRRLTEAVEALPLPVAGYPYNAHATQAALSDTSVEELQDAPWHRVRGLLRLCRYALEILEAPPADAPDAARLYGAGRALDRHREAADAASAAAAAARTPRITPATAYALGVLHADQRAEVEASRYAFSRVWQGVAAAPHPPYPDVVTAGH